MKRWVCEWCGASAWTPGGVCHSPLCYQEQHKGRALPVDPITLGESVRIRGAMILVKMAAWPIHNAYRNNMLGNKRREEVWGKLVLPCRIYLEWAFKVHKSAAGNQAAMEGWWG